MERVAFVLTHSEERISCLLNPESLSLKRTAGIRLRSSIGGAFVSSGLSDTALLHTGGGVTELIFELLFDTSIAGSTIVTDDVRDLTAPLWELAENMIGPDGVQYPPQVRFVWGKSWNIPGLVVAVAEKFDRFTKDGSPTRSWMKLKMLRALGAEENIAAVQFRHKYVSVPEKREDASVTEMSTHTVVSGDRLDVLAANYYGDPSYWRVLALYNGIVDPLDLEVSSVIYILPKSQLELNR